MVDEIEGEGETSRESFALNFRLGDGRRVCDAEDEDEGWGEDDGKGESPLDDDNGNKGGRAGEPLFEPELDLEPALLRKVFNELAANNGGLLLASPFTNTVVDDEDSRFLDLGSSGITVLSELSDETSHISLLVDTPVNDEETESLLGRASEERITTRGCTISSSPHRLPLAIPLKLPTLLSVPQLDGRPPAPNFEDNRPIPESFHDALPFASIGIGIDDSAVDSGPVEVDA